MTQREAQILQWIQENPLISQQELADRAGITRSSVAVHISNLMKRAISTAKATSSAPPHTPWWWAGEHGHRRHALRSAGGPGLQSRQSAHVPGRCGDETSPITWPFWAWTCA